MKTRFQILKDAQLLYLGLSNLMADEEELQKTDPAEYLKQLRSQMAEIEAQHDVIRQAVEVGSES